MDYFNNPFVGGGGVGLNGIDVAVGGTGVADGTGILVGIGVADGIGVGVVVGGV